MQLSSSSARKGEAIQYFSLDLFPRHCILAFDQTLGILSLLACVRQQPRLLAQHRFVSRESDLLLALLTGYPAMVPYEILHVSFYQGFDCLCEQSTLRAKQRLDGLRSSGESWNVEIRPLRKSMARIRLGLQAVGLDASCQIESGYVLEKRSGGGPLLESPIRDDSSRW